MPYMADSESILHKYRLANSRKVRSPEKMEAILSSSHRQDTFRVLKNPLVSNEYLIE